MISNKLMVTKRKQQDKSNIHVQKINIISRKYTVILTTGETTLNTLNKWPTVIQHANLDKIGKIHNT